MRRKLYLLKKGYIYVFQSVCYHYFVYNINIKKPKCTNLYQAQWLEEYRILQPSHYVISNLQQVHLSYNSFIQSWFFKNKTVEPLPQPLIQLNLLVEVPKAMFKKLAVLPTVQLHSD